MHQRYRNTRTALALADGLDWNDLHTATPIGASCYVCTREDCAQRAYPPIHRPLLIDAHESTVAPY